MKVNTNDMPCRRPDGSIDTDLYVARGRMSRSMEARSLFKRIALFAARSWRVKLAAAWT